MKSIYISFDVLTRAENIFAEGNNVSVADVTSLLSELTETMKLMDEAISSIQGQLDTRDDGDWQWRDSASRALRRFLRKRESVAIYIKTARSLLITLEVREAQVRKQEQKEAGRILAEKYANAAMQKREMALNEDRRMLASLKSVLQERLGREVYLEMIFAAKEHMKQP